MKFWRRKPSFDDELIESVKRFDRDKALIAKGQWQGGIISGGGLRVTFGDDSPEAVVPLTDGNGMLRPLSDWLPRLSASRGAVRYFDPADHTPEKVAKREVERRWKDLQASLCLCRFTHEDCCEHEPERLDGDCPVHGPHVGWDDG